MEEMHDFSLSLVKIKMYRAKINHLVAQLSLKGEIIWRLFFNIYIYILEFHAHLKTQVFTIPKNIQLHETIRTLNFEIFFFFS